MWRSDGNADERPDLQQEEAWCQPSTVGAASWGRVVRLPEVLEITGLSRTTIWRRERDGSFPSPFRLGGERTRAVGWREQDIYDWIDGLSPAA